MLFVGLKSIQEGFFDDLFLAPVSLAPTHPWWNPRAFFVAYVLGESHKLSLQIDTFSERFFDAVRNSRTFRYDKETILEDFKIIWNDF